MGLIDKAKSVFKGHGDTAKSGVDKGAGMADDRTGGKYTDKIDAGSDKVKDGIDDFTQE
jgi:hypothetical protein